jgi:hypothetical protein
VARRSRTNSSSVSFRGSIGQWMVHSNRLTLKGKHFFMEKVHLGSMAQFREFLGLSGLTSAFLGHNYDWGEVLWKRWRNVRVSA